MKHERAPALNRFENELARAIDARAGRSAVRRNARVLALASLVVLALVAGVTYAWMEARDTSTGVATSGPDEDATTPPGESSAGDARVLFDPSGTWSLGAESTGVSTCVVLRGITAVNRVCGTMAEFESSLARSPVAVQHVTDPEVWGGIARADVAFVDFLDAADRVVASAPTIDDPRLPGRAWATDADLDAAIVAVARSSDGADLGRSSYPEHARNWVADSLRPTDAVDVERVANAGIIGLGTDDPDLFIDDPRGLAERRSALAAIYPEQTGKTALVMRRITFTSETEAEFVYDVLLGPPLDDRSMHGLVGHAVRIDGQWRITRATACQIWGFGAGTCPPPE